MSNITYCAKCAYCSTTYFSPTVFTGQCRKHPPKVCIIGNEPVTLWPEIRGHDCWCGDGVEYHKELMEIRAKMTPDEYLKQHDNQPIDPPVSKGSRK